VSVPARLLHELVTRAAERRPEATAVVSGEERLSYAALDEQSSRLARTLQGLGCGPGERVALLAPKSLRTIVAVVAAYKAGAVLVPLDPASPPARQARILRSAGPACLLAGDGTAARVRELLRTDALSPAVRLGWLGAPWTGERAELEAEFDWEDLAGMPAAALPTARRSEDPAHILYTSGSTGDPKGVPVRHASVLAFVAWAVAHYGIAADERLSQHAPLHFDLSTFDLFGAFAAGAELHLVPPRLSLLPHLLADFIRSSELTQWFSVPAVLTQLASFGVVRPGDFPALRRLLWCGEVFPTPSLIHWMQRLPRVAFGNLYGPTETTIASSYYDVPACPQDERAAIPIGTPCRGEELLVLDAGRRPVAAGEVGELYIRGVGLSPGYWRDPERTRQAFLPDPEDPASRIYRTGDLARVGEDGLFYLVGRIDSQIKSRGYRIELGEVETAIAATGLTQEVVVTAIPTDGFEGHSICCAYVPAPGRDAEPVALRRELGRLLPAYMIPQHWMTWERLPRNGSGKLDRRIVQETFAGMAGPPPRARQVAGL
jgi:amino acid adenylation domain-containing protein